MKRLSFRKSLAAVIGILLVIGLLWAGFGRADAKTARAAKGSSRTVILYFSGTGNTAKIAKKVQKASGAKLIRIKAKDPYTDADLDYSQASSRVVQEHESNGGDDKTPLDSKVRPQIANQKQIARAVKKADTVYIGYPIWWQQAPHIIYTLVENTNLKGKTVIPFNSSMASGSGSSASNLKKAAKAKNRINSKTTWKKGKGFTDDGPSQKSISSWVSRVQK